MTIGSDDILRALATREGQIKVIAILGLAFYVRMKGRPWPAAALLTLVVLVMEALAGGGPVFLVLRGLIVLLLSSALFWSLDRAHKTGLFIALTVAGIAIFLFLV
jgi:hypothetical protein